MPSCTLCDRMATRAKLGPVGTNLLKAVPVLLVGIFGVTRFNSAMTPPEERPVPPMSRPEQPQTAAMRGVRNASQKLIQQVEKVYPPDAPRRSG